MTVMAKKMSDSAAHDAMRADSSIRIAVICDHLVFCEDLVRMLQGVDGIEVVGKGTTAAEAIEVATKLSPDIILLYFRLPGSSIETAGRIARACPSVRIAILTESENDQDVALALKAGVRGYVMTNSSGREVVETVRGIVRDDTRAEPKLGSRLLIKNGERIDTVAYDNLRDLSLFRSRNAPARQE